MPKTHRIVRNKRPAHILGIRPWVLLVGGLTFAATHAIAKSKIRRRATAHKDGSDGDSLPASDPAPGNAGVDPGKD